MKAHINASIFAGVIDGVQLGSLLNPLLIRGNTVGYMAVAPYPYDTNSGVTTKTVGTGGTYATLNLAWTAAVAGDVIEILDDSTTLTGRLTINKGVNGSGKSIKIKGKSTKTILVMPDNDYPIYCAGGTNAVEFENIIFSDPYTPKNLTVFFNNTDNIGGHCHFINCEVEAGTTGYFYLYNAKDAVFDNVNFRVSFIDSVNDATLNANATTMLNNCQGLGTNLIRSNNYKNIIATNCQATTTSDTIKARIVSNVIIKGNRLQSINASPVRLGHEATGSSIYDDQSGFASWNNSTAYVVGNIRQYRCLLYECMANNTNSTPNRNVNTDWRLAKRMTGEISHNTLYRTTAVGGGHGLFVGYGCYDFVIENNITSNYWYGIVVKGHSNYIRYNAVGRCTANGLIVVSNDQREVRNNTVRSLESGLAYGPQSTDTEGLISTTFRDNIFVSTGTSQVLFDDRYSLWVSPPTIANTSINNKYFGVTPTGAFAGTLRILTSVFAAFKTAIGDSKAEFIDPQFVGSDSTLPDYYKPSNPLYLKMIDQFKQSVGAIDYK